MPKATALLQCQSKGKTHASVSQVVLNTGFTLSDNRPILKLKHLLLPANGLNVGNNTAKNYLNKFYNLQCGIIVFRSNLKAVNNMFKITGIAQTSYGICARGTNPVIHNNPMIYTLTIGGYNANEGNQFKSLYCGVFSMKNMKLLAYKNLIDTASFGVFLSQNEQAGTNSEIVRNRITYVDRAVTANLNLDGSTIINNNFIECKPSVVSYGVKLTGGSNIPLNNLERYTIQADTIRAGIAIDLLDCYLPFMKCNLITVYSNNMYSYGMHITNCNLHQSQNNSITGVSKNQRTFGTSIIDGYEFRYLCGNNISNTDTAFDVKGQNTTYYNSIRTENWINNRVGFRLSNNGYTGPIGDPTHPCKLVWNTPANTHDTWSFFSDGSLNTFYTTSSSNENPIINQGDRYPSSAVVLSELQITGTTSSCANINCNGVAMLMMNSDTGRITSQYQVLQGENPSFKGFYNVINDRINYPIFPNQASWIGKQEVYYVINNDTAFYFPETALKQFKLQMDTTNTGVLYKVEAKINLDSLDDASILNESIIPKNAMEETHQSVYRYLIKYLREDTLDVESVRDLRNIAVRCPLEYGRGVYQARALLTVFDSLGTEYTSSCNGVAYEKHMQTNPSSTDFDPSGQMLIYPNPAMDLVTVEYLIEGTSSSSRISIYDLMGREVYSQELAENSGTLLINTSIFLGGVYFVKIYNILGLLNQSRLVILK